MVEHVDAFLLRHVIEHIRGFVIGQGNRLLRQKPHIAFARVADEQHAIRAFEDFKAIAAQRIRHALLRFRHAEHADARKIERIGSAGSHHQAFLRSLQALHCHIHRMPRQRSGNHLDLRGLRLRHIEHAIFPGLKNRKQHVFRHDGRFRRAHIHLHQRVRRRAIGQRFPEQQIIRYVAAGPQHLRGQRGFQRRYGAVQGQLVVFPNVYLARVRLRRHIRARAVDQHHTRAQQRPKFSSHIFRPFPKRSYPLDAARRTHVPVLGKKSFLPPRKIGANRGLYGPFAAGSLPVRRATCCQARQNVLH